MTKIIGEEVIKRLISHNVKAIHLRMTFASGFNWNNSSVNADEGKSTQAL